MLLCKNILFCFGIALIAHAVAVPIQSSLKRDVDAKGIVEDELCKGCRYVVEVLHRWLGDRIVDDCLADAIVFICETVGIEDNLVCNGMIGTFKDEYLYVLDQVIVEPDEICGILLSDCGTPNYDPSKQTWWLPIPGNKPPYVPPTLPQADAAKLRVLHLSDLHVDMYYRPGSEALCGEPLCCRDPDETHEKKVKISEKVKKLEKVKISEKVKTSKKVKTSEKVKMAAGQWGTQADCDTPYWTLVNMLQHINNTHKDLDYIVLTGDYMSHADWDYTTASHMAMLRNLTALMKEYFPHTPQYWTLGNHEGVPVDARGSYMTPVLPGLRIVSLNSVFGDSNNLWLYLNETDPDGTMSWLLEQLVEAEKVGDKVQVIAHIPGGTASWSANYYNVIKRFESTVVGQFFGHTHQDEYWVYFEDDDDHKSRAIGSVLAAGSVTTYGEHNPAYRIYSIDGNYPGTSFRLLDFDEYFLNLTEANANPSNPQWQLLYSAKESYGLKSLFPSEMANLITRMKTDDELYQKYINHRMRTNNNAWTEKDRINDLCDMRSLADGTNKTTMCADLDAIYDFYRKSEVVSKPLKKEMILEQLEQKKAMARSDSCPI